MEELEGGTESQNCSALCSRRHPLSPSCPSHPLFLPPSSFLPSLSSYPSAFQAWSQILLRFSSLWASIFKKKKGKGVHQTVEL